jgi:hypothetical protein
VEFPVALYVYAAMLAGTVGGQFLGMAVDAFALGRRVFWVPLAFSLVLEALAGERVGAARFGHPLAPRERAKLSLTYSAGLAAVSLVLAGWLGLSHATREQVVTGNGLVPSGFLHTLVLGLCVAVAYTAARTVLMRLFRGRA